MVQYNRDNRAFEGAQNTNVTIDTLVRPSLVCLSVCLSGLSGCLVWSVCLSVCLVCLVCLPACLPVCLSVCLPVCLPARMTVVSCERLSWFTGRRLVVWLSWQCDYMMTVGDPVAAYATVSNLVNFAGPDSCLDISYTDMITMLQNTSTASPAAEGGRQWTYQTCA